MHPHKRDWILVNLIGGPAVLASYVIWIGNPTHDATALWGTIGGAGRMLYTLSMLTAAAGYFLFATYLLRQDASAVRVGRHDFSLFATLFALILFPSALWMPLAFEYLTAPSALHWWAMRLDLFVVGLASLALIPALAATTPRRPGRTPAIVGACLFAFQTALLDMLVWPLRFPR